MDNLKEIFKNKKMVIILIIILSFLLICLFSFNKKESKKAENQGLTGNTSRGIVKEEIYKGIKFSNNSLTTENNFTVFTTTVINLSEKDSSLEKYYLLLKDKKGEVIGKMLIYIPKGLKKGESKTINATIGGEYKKAVSKEIVEHS